MSNSNGFFEQVYLIVAQIPLGNVATYGQIALLAGKPGAARAVGYAMSGATHQRGLPCHRVVNRKGSLAPEYAFGGKDHQRYLLESEGVTFREDGCIDIKEHIWRP